MKLKKLIVASLAIYGGVTLADKWAEANRDRIKKKLQDGLYNGAVHVMGFIFGDPIPSGQTLDDDENIVLVPIVDRDVLKPGMRYWYETRAGSFLAKEYHNEEEDRLFLDHYLCYIMG